MEKSESMNDLEDMVDLANANRDDDLEIINSSSFPDSNSSPSNNEPMESTGIVQDVFIDEADEINAKHMSHWFINDVGILPSLDRLYCAKLFEHGIGTIPRLAKKLSKDPSFLKDIGFKLDDADDVYDALLKDGLLTSHSTEPPPLPSSLPPSGTPRRMSNADTYGSGIEEISTREKSVSNAMVIDEPVTYVTQASAQIEAVRRKARRGENSEKFKELVNEATKLCDNLRAAIEGKMDLAVSGELKRIAVFVENSFEKQKAMGRANCAPVITSTIKELGGSSSVCEQAMVVIALLCRHSDENKASVNYENAKVLGLVAACECVGAALVKHVEDPKVVEAAMDAIRCLCCLESNQARFGTTIACETVGRCLSHPAFSHNAELCCWICRAIGHLCASLNENRELVGSVGACEHIIVVMQRFQHNLNLCIEVCWAIRNVAPIYNNRARLANEHGPECIAAIYKFHLNSENFAIEATRALISLIASEDDDIIPRIANSGVLSFIIKSYKRYNDSEFLARWVFNLMYYVACDVRLIPRLLSIDILSVLSTTLDMHAGYEPLAEWGLRTVSKLTNLQGILGKMRLAGLCEVTVSTVQRQAISSTVCAHGLLAIGELATDVANHDRLSTAAASEAIIGALKRHDNNIDVVNNGCYAIHWLCSTENINSWMGANGGCDAVTNALIKHTASNITITKTACRAIGSLAYHDEGNINRLAAADACEAIVRALRTYTADAEVAEYACRAIYHMCYENNNVKEFGKKGACGLVVSVLQNHGNKASVVAQACLAIHALAVKIKIDKVHAGNTRKLVEKKAIEAVVEVMQKYPSNAEVQQAAAMAVTSLGRLESNRNALGSANACELVMTGMDNHASNGAVMGKLALAVEVLSTGSDQHKAKFAEGRTVESLLQTLMKQEKHGVIVSELFRALIVMLTHEQSRILIRSEPSCKQIVKAIRIHERDIIPSKYGCQLVYSLCSDDIARMRFGSFRACEAIVSILNKLGMKDVQVAGWGCKAMFALSVLDENKARFANNDSCHAVIKTLKEHVEDMIVAEWACAVIVSIAPIESNRSRLGAGVGCQTLQAVLQKQHRSEVIARLSCEAIYELAHETSNRVSFGKADTCESLVSCLSTHNNSASVSQQICRAISMLAKSTPDNGIKFGAAGICELLSETQRMHANFNASFAEWSCAAVTSLCEGNKTNQSAFGNANICENMMMILKSHRTEEIVVIQATRAIRAISIDHTENIRRLSIIGAVGTTLASLRAHAVSASVAENSGWILARIPTPAFLDDTAAADKQAASAAVSEKDNPSTPVARDLYKSIPAWDLLALVLETHYARELACKWISNAIFVFAERGCLSSHHEDVCESLMKAFRYHVEKDSGKILPQLLTAIGAVATNNLENSNYFLRDRCCENVDAILTLYMLRIESEPVFAACLRAIGGLALNNPAAQERVYSIPTLPKNILRALYNDLENEEVAKHGCAAIAILCHKNRMLQYKLGPAESYLVDIVQVHKHVPTIHLELCKVVSRLSHTHITNRNRLGASGICDELAKILNKYLAASSNSQSNKSPHANPAVPSSQRFKHPVATEAEVEEILRWAVRAVADLAANNPNNQTKLGLSGCCEAVVNVLRRALEPSHADAAMVKYCCWAIGNLVQLGKGPTMVIDESANAASNSKFKVLRTTNAKKNTARFGAAGLPQLIKTVLIDYSENQELMVWCLRAVNNLAKSRTTKAQLVEIGVLGPVQLIAGMGLGMGNMSDSIGNETFSLGKEGSDRGDVGGQVKYWAMLARSSLTQPDFPPMTPGPAPATGMGSTGPAHRLTLSSFHGGGGSQSAIKRKESDASNSGI
jgi:hypothetical protein